jgi:hypothetical protein
MKRAVKLQRREMKRKIKRITEENEKLKSVCRTLRNPFLNEIPRNDYQSVVCASIINYPPYCSGECFESIKNHTKIELAHNLGEFLFNNGLCEIEEINSAIGLEIRLYFRFRQ